MEPPLPNLKLIIVQGLRSGETLEFKPGSVIRIGRIKRGNTLSISEDAISTKHLVFDSKSGKWTIEDLDSSNGTILNTAYLSPNSPVDLHDNDNFEIGKETVITVKFKAAIKEESVLRRNPRRQENARVTRSQTKNEELVENLEVKCKVVKEGIVTRKGQGRGKNLQEIPPESGLLQVESNENLKLEQVASGGDVEGKKSAMKCEEVMEKSSKMTGRGRGRGRRRMRNSPEIPPESSEVEVENNDKLRSEELVCGRDVKDTVEIEVNRDVAESSNKAENNVVNRGVKESGDQVEERVESDVNRDGNTAGIKVGSGVEDNGPNLEKMTLGEWFDYMEVYLLKEATEEMIEGMRRKAERLHNYMRQQKRQWKMEKGTILVFRLACKLGEVKEAVDVWNEMEASGFSVGIDSFVVMIHGVLGQGCLVEACESLKEMVGRVLLSAPQYGTLKELLNSLQRAEKLELAKDVWSCILTKGCELNVYAWTIWIHSLFSKSQKLMRGLKKLYNRQLAAEIAEKVRKMADEREITFKMYKRCGERDLKEKFKEKKDGKKRRARRRQWGGGRVFESLVLCPSIKKFNLLEIAASATTRRRCYSMFFQLFSLQFTYSNELLNIVEGPTIERGFDTSLLLLCVVPSPELLGLLWFLITTAIWLWPFWNSFRMSYKGIVSETQARKACAYISHSHTTMCTDKGIAVVSRAVLHLWGVGAVIRDSAEEVIAAIWKIIEGVFSVEVGEFLALREGLSCGTAASPHHLI
ncbi:hypothetical protein EZV62_014031 [Acer yangbiense]|uniref:FHA domain-containing protein n=1 Tax=Acer yangbiense TaxID=1000413 RepID=A0A5C7HRM5_9ROSI|nr:hypothetical protein EZV62_014031 [Acer yangbiense]